MMFPMFETNYMCHFIIMKTQLFVSLMIFCYK